MSNEKHESKAIEEKGHDIVVVPRTDAQPPEKLTGLRTNKPKQNSVGLPGIFASVTHATKYMRPNEAIRTMFRMNQQGGFDCPGCAWPDPDDDRSGLGEYCENGIKAIAEEAQNKRIGRDFFAAHSVQEMAGWSDFEIGKKGRLAEPMVLWEGETHYQPIAWQEAFDLMGQELQGLESPNEAVFYTSGRTSNEAAFLYQLMVREYGTNNLPDCSNMCHESSGAGLAETVGIGKGSVTLTDLYEADVIMVIGQNPGTNHPRMLSALEKCKENGGKIITVNPLPEAGLLRFTNPQRPLKMVSGGTKLTDLFLPVRVNEDVALLKALMKLLLEFEQESPGSVVDQAFIQEFTTGYAALVADLATHSLEGLIAKTGLAEADVREAAAMLRNTNKIIICWAMGITQHENGVDNVREIVNLLLMKGAIGIPGAGTCPVRGHSNVQGDRTMGIWEAPKPAFLDKLKEVVGFEPPRDHGFAVVDAITAMHQGKAKFFFAMGGNFISATPDTELTAEALRRCQMTVHVSTKLNRSHLIHGKVALILPCLGRTEVDTQATGEQMVSCENSMGVVQSSRGVLPPSSFMLKSEPAIVAGLAKSALGVKSMVDWDALVGDYDRIRDLIEKVIPGFANYNERLRQPGGFYLPNGARIRQFNTTSGKAQFTVNRLSEVTVPEGEYLMMTIRSHDQYNTTIYGLDDRYRGIYNERRVVLMNEKDIKASGFKAGQTVDLISEYDGIRREAKRFIIVAYPIPRQCVGTYFPEANVLVPLHLQARKSKTPASKSVRIRLEKH